MLDENSINERIKVLDSDIPKKSKKWMLEQSIIVKADSIEAMQLEEE